MQDNDLSAIGGVGASTPVSEVSRDQSLGRDEFLKLLIAQLQNQDPLSPEDPSKFVSELTQFSNLEQLIGIKEGVDAIGASNSKAAGVLDAVPLIGREVLASGNQIEVDDDYRGRLAYDLPRDANQGTLKLFRGNTLVSQQQLANAELGAGRHHLELQFPDDGRVAPGVYHYVLDVELGGEPLTAIPYISGTATGARAANFGGEVSVLLGAIEVPLRDTFEVREPR